MSQLGTSNLNLNLNLGSSNLNLGAGGGGAPRGGRVNTQEFRKLVDSTKFPFPPGSAGAERNTIDRLSYPEFWDAGLQSYLYLNEFVVANGNWLATLVTALTVTAEKLHSDIDEELAKVVDAAPEREARFAEIIQQDTAEGALSYWTGMLALDVGHAPATRLLVRVGQRVGELAAMCLKHAFRVPRPSQLCAAIVPMIDPPQTAAFPSGHALQAHLISLCLKDVRGQLPQTSSLLDDLASRVAENRVIAGLHYPLDSVGGEEAAKECFRMLTKPGESMFKTLLGLARDEFLPEPPEAGGPPNRLKASIAPVGWGRRTPA